MRMIRCWLIAAALGAMAGLAHAADVQVFGIHTPSQGKWAVYARISNAQSNTPTPGKENVAGISSISFDLLNNTDATLGGSATVNTAATLMLPRGTTNQTDSTVGPVGYGFWFFASGGTADGTGLHGVTGSQYATYPASGSSISSTQWDSYVLQQVGLSSGSKLTGGDFTSATSWFYPVLLAQGTYTPSATTGNASKVGPKIHIGSDLNINVLKDTDPTSAVKWSGYGNVETANAFVVDAKTFLPGASVSELSTTRAVSGDATLDGTVDLTDLAQLAAHYGMPGTWFDGDFNYDGIVDLSDLALMAANYGQTFGSEAVPSASFSEDMAIAFASVPEPTGVVGTLIGLVIVMRRRRR